MHIYKVVKRNWEVVDFSRDKISVAIIKSIKSVWWNNFSDVDNIVNLIINLLFDKHWTSIPTVEDIQDCVEEILIKEWHDEVSKSFILYRQKRAELRSDKNVVVQVNNTMKEYLDKSDWRVNANANSWYSLWGLILNISWKIIANYWLSHIYPKNIWNAHRNWDIHIHDLDIFSWYCAWWSLRQLLEEWFNWLSDRVNSEPPKNLQSAVNQMINFLWTLQNERAWAQAFSSFDTYLAPFVHKYKESLISEIKEFWIDFKSQSEKDLFLYNKTYKYVYQQLQNLIFWLNVPSRWWTQTPFTNITLDWNCPDDLKDKSLFLWWIENWPYKLKYWELEGEMRIINEALIDIYTKWDANWNVFTFPIPTYNITENFPWDDKLVDKLFEMTAKYWLPYFQNFVWSQFKTVIDEYWNKVRIKNENAYKPWAVRSMCCRLQLDLTQLEKRWNWLFWSAEMTWSIWVVTINMARIWYNYKWDLEWFKNQISYLMELWKTSLELKRKELSIWLDKWLYPYTKRYLNSFRNHFSTIWLNWMNEAILNFTNWEYDITSEYWIKFALDILDFMRDKLKIFQEETWNLYNLEATPAEWTTYRFAKEDKKQIHDIIQAWTLEAPYYTNSSQLPVWYTDDAFEALDLQNELQCKYTWWTVLHMYMWERISDANSCKELVRRIISQYQLPYITITPTFSICPVHWYINWEHDFCPKCDLENGYNWIEFDIETRRKYTSDLIKIKELEWKNI